MRWRSILRSGCHYRCLDEVFIRLGPDRRHLEGSHRRHKYGGAQAADKTLRHGGQIMTAWGVAHACVEPKGNSIIITKQASGSAKIDPLMAAFNAIALMSTNPWSHQASIFVI
jgi:hypothetical protein